LARGFGLLWAAAVTVIVLTVVALVAVDGACQGKRVERIVTSVGLKQFEVIKGLLVRRNVDANARLFVLAYIQAR
jgi:hypothetical protein